MDLNEGGPEQRNLEISFSERSEESWIPESLRWRSLTFMVLSHVRRRRRWGHPGKTGVYQDGLTVLLSTCYLYITLVLNWKHLSIIV